MDFILNIVSKQILGGKLSDLGKDFVTKYIRGKMEEAVPKISAKLADKDISDPDREKKLHDLVREILFLLWKAVVKKGPIADLIRDLHYDYVLAHVMPKLLAENFNVTMIAQLTMESTLEHAF